jgi:hypothetical protein
VGALRAESPACLVTIEPFAPEIQGEVVVAEPQREPYTCHDRHLENADARLPAQLFRHGAHGTSIEP